MSDSHRERSPTDRRQLKPVEYCLDSWMIWLDDPSYLQGCWIEDRRAPILDRRERGKWLYHPPEDLDQTEVKIIR